MADASAKSKNYLAIKNIYMPNDIDFEGKKTNWKNYIKIAIYFVFMYKKH